VAKKIPNIVKQIRKYTSPEINFSYQKVISFSQLSMYTSCPLKWSLQYKDGHKRFTSTIHTMFGTALHEAIQHYLTVMYEQSGVAADKEDIIGIFEESYRKEYKLQYEKNKKQHFSNPTEMREFFEDGIEIINFIKKNKGKYFSKRGWYLVGCELPITVYPHPHYKHVVYQGYLDVVMYHEPTNKFKIIDIKTSTNGWKDYAKKDEIKQAQLILYKKFFGDQFNIPYDDIEVEFFIVKRKVYTEGDFPQKRIQEFKPPSGKIKINKAYKLLNEFIEGAFNKNGYKEIEHKANPSKWNCSYCPFFEEKHLCFASSNHPSIRISDTTISQ
jgi:hypothetical protein